MNGSDRRWQLFVFPFAGVLLGFSTLVGMLVLATTILPIEYLQAVLTFTTNPSAFENLPTLTSAQRRFAIAAGVLPPLSSVVLFLTGYYLALRNNRIAPPDVDPFEIAEAFIEEMAQDPYDIDLPEPPV